MKREELVKKLNINDFLQTFTNFFAREKEYFMEGDVNRHLEFIKAIEKIDFKAPPKIKSLLVHINSVNKFGILRLEDIFEIIKIIRYFNYLQSLEFAEPMESWLQKIKIPEYFLEISELFNEKGEFDEQKDVRLVQISQKIASIKENIRESYYQLQHSKKLEYYLVDRQIHLINGREALLLRGGFNTATQGSIIGRSGQGFFYVVPDSVENHNKKIRNLEQEKEEILYEYQKEISKKLKEFVLFLKFIDKQFDVFDSYQARLFFAKALDLNFIASSKTEEIKIADFYHPALIKDSKNYKNLVPTNLEFPKNSNVLMVTGVNAGGKTMLLKSILTVVYLAKYLIPFKINPEKSIIGRFKNIEAIIEDPQNVKSDISTFAGRMMDFSSILKNSNSLIGVDEIELGTDSDEASALFKVLLEELIHKNNKIIVTTHHKRLASLMAFNEKVILLAAIYNEEKQQPTYRFLKGIVGKSYAFETAERYSIPKFLVTKARKVYGEDSEKLNELIEKSSFLERELIEKNRALDEKIANAEKELQTLKDERLKHYSLLENEKNKLEKDYSGAITEAKKAIKAKTVPVTHSHMTKASKLKPEYSPKKPKAEIEFKVGDKVRYNSSEGEIISINTKKKRAKIEVNGFKLEVDTFKLQLAVKKNIKNNNITIQVSKPETSALSIDLHGMRREEALEELEKFISDALLQGWDEVLITHGIGTGILARTVTDFLRNHKSIGSFSDAPSKMGGAGSKLVRL
jgi:DNA mismatch repair protein MutS2